MRLESAIPRLKFFSLPDASLYCFLVSLQEMTETTPLNLPARIAGLEEIAYNLWWSWHPQARSLFKMLDRTLWRKTHHNPVNLLHSCQPERLQAIAKEPAFLQDYDVVMAELKDYLKADKT